MRTTYQYVVDLRERLEETCQIVQEQSSKSSKRYKYYADIKKKDRQLQQGDEVLLLLPTDNNKLLMQWKGLFVVTEKINPYDYKVNIDGKVKTYHGNMLMKYHRRQAANEGSLVGTTVSCVSVIETEGKDTDDTGHSDTRDSNELKLHFPVLLAKETVKDVQVNPELDRGARWLSGRVSDSGARGRGFDTYRRRVVSLSKTLYSPKVLVNYPGSGGSVPT